MGYHSDWAILITATATLIYTANYVWRRYDSTMTVEGDQLTLHRLAADSLTYQRGNWMFRARFKDILEWLFGGGSGSLAIVHPVTGAELFVANHVPGFRRIAEKIQRQFSTTDVTHSAHVERPEEVAVH